VSFWSDPRAACRGVDVAVFYNLTPANKEMALALCGECPVRAACLEYVMRWETGVAKFGIWGGLTPEERRKLVKNGAWKREHAAKTEAA
jgi:WhiB family redox-sensing transcriptional regulator